MRVRGIDVDGEWMFGRGTSDYLINQRAVMQDINTRLKCFVGDCFFDLALGIDWFNLLGGKDLLAVNMAISTMILNTKNVTGMIQLTTGLDLRRNFSVSYKVSTVYSVLSSSVNFSNTVG